MHPGTYRDLFVPAHLAAFAALVALTAWFNRATSADGRVGRRTRTALAALVALAVLSLPVDAIAGAVAFAMFFAVILGGFAVPVIGLVRAVLVQRSGRSAEERWRDHARSAQIALWFALCVALPATLASVYVDGAGFFCF